MADPQRLAPTLIDRFDMDPDRLIDLLGDGLGSVDDGELFLEYRETESLAFDDGRLKSAAFDSRQGFGLRAVAGEAVGCAHSPDFSEAAVVRALEAVGAVRIGHSGTLALPSTGTNQRRYTGDNPIQAEDHGRKVAVLEQIDA
jgi:TldD protein